MTSSKMIANVNNKRSKMETVKTLLENTKQDLEMKLWWAEEHDKEPQFDEDIPILKQKIADIDEALLRLFSVVGRSEQLKPFHCPNCKQPWDTRLTNSCQCGASIKRF